MGNPHEKLRCIHVAGTNGKGSVCLKLAKTLEAHKFKVGLYTSPHLFYYGERIQINSQPWDEDYVADALQRIFDLAVKDNSLQLTFFDSFAENKVDFGVIECGLGGTLDSTNVISQPLLSVITSIGFDHTEILGNTLSQIALAKSGIIKKDCPVVIGPLIQNHQQPHHTSQSTQLNQQSPLEVFEETAKRLNSPFHVVPKHSSQLLDYDIENQDIVRVSLGVLRDSNSDLNSVLKNDIIEQSLKVQQKCRMEPMQTKKIPQNNQPQPKKIYFDVAHNPPALERMLLRLQKYHPDCRIRAVYGTSSLKDATEALHILAMTCSAVHLISAQHFRAMNIAQLISCSEQLSKVSSNYDSIIQPVIDNGDIHKTLSAAVSQCDYKEILVVCGSFFIQTEARDFFGIADKIDPLELSHRN